MATLTLQPGELAQGNAQLPFEEQIKAFREKAGNLVATEHWDDILKEAHDKAFIVAGAMQADLLTDLYQAVDAAIAAGTSIQQFKTDFKAIVAKHGWAHTGAADWRARVIYLTNLRTSYSAGRWRQLSDPALLAINPYWQYVHNDSVHHPRPLHVAWSGTTLKPDDPWWQVHYPPGGFGCRCRVVSTAKLDPIKNQAPQNGTYEHVDRNGEVHTLPKGIDYGWDYAPGATWTPDLTKYPAPIASGLSELLKRHD